MVGGMPSSEQGEALSVFPLTVTIQRIALEFAAQLGTEPDDVRPQGWGAIELLGRRDLPASSHPRFAHARKWAELGVTKTVLR